MPVTYSSIFFTDTANVKKLHEYFIFLINTFTKIIQQFNEHFIIQTKAPTNMQMWQAVCIGSSNYMWIMHHGKAVHGWFGDYCTARSVAGWNLRPDAQDVLQLVANEEEGPCMTWLTGSCFRVRLMCITQIVKISDIHNTLNVNTGQIQDINKCHKLYWNIQCLFNRACIGNIFCIIIKIIIVHQLCAIPPTRSLLTALHKSLFSLIFEWMCFEVWFGGLERRALFNFLW